jgi:dephospho-CoA kinase
MTIFVAAVGMPGSGKTLVGDMLVARGFHYARFGQAVIDELHARGLPMNEENERAVREDLRRQHGMAAVAILNLPKFDALLAQGNLIGDGLYSWAEYKLLKERYGDRLVVVAIHAPPAMRYARLTSRTLHAQDTAQRYRPITSEVAKSRDIAEIEHIEKGGPIAMADYHIVNQGTTEELAQKVDEFLAWLAIQPAFL